MGRLRRTMRMERLESRSLLAAALGIADVVVDQATAEPQVATSIEINNAAGIRAATVEILYDQNLLQADLASVRAGSIWEGKGVAIANLNDQDGKITAFIFATEDMSLSSGTLLDIDFMFNEGTPEDARAHVGLGSVRLNEGDIPVSAVPMPGHKTIDGSITRQAGAGRPQIQEPIRSAPRPDVPVQFAVAVRNEVPQASATQRLPEPSRVAAPSVAAKAVATPPQELPMHRRPLAGDGPQPATETHDRFHCAPWSGTTSGKIIENPPLATAGVSNNLLLPPPAEFVIDTLSSQAAVKGPAGEARALPFAVLEKPGILTGRSAPDSPHVLLAVKAKQVSEVLDPVQRSPVMVKSLPLFVSSASSNHAARFSDPLLWLLSGRGSGESQNNGVNEED